MPQFENINLAQIYGATDEAKSRQLQNQMMQNQFARQQRQDQENDSIKGAYAVNPDGSLDEKTTLGNLYKVAPTKAYEFQQTLTQRDMANTKAKREEQTAKLGDAEKVYSLLKKSSGAVLANPTLQNAIQVTQQFGALTGSDVSSELANLQQIGDNPEGLKRWAAGHALEADKLLPQFKSQDIGGSIQQQSIDPITGQVTVTGNIGKTQSPDSIASNYLTRRGQDITMRGQNMVDSRSRETNANGGKAPSGFRYLPNGDLEAIKGGPGDKKVNPSEGERKAATLLQRLEFSQQQLKDVTEKTPSANNPSLISNGLESVGADALANWNKDPARRQAEAAQLDILDAALTLGTGAAYTKEQLQGYRKSYFPQIGDDAATIQAKADRLNNVIEAGRTQAGRAAPTEKPNVPNPATSAPKPGTVKSGYVFIGGDPAKQSSWKKQ